ncbi:YfhO family protein [Planctomyces sp. SH-PL62]|uniref:YfhO family protein n=1 Tax=Planctomyces sp. SH-PL62 TaxID=1636152 RepID=UPI00078C69F5|nr:YfhO family protein [Planctomyces sp. SH-PL62]AMV37082.1 Bacterial membrane protein YfhO [Planctomyces sp. SH-PL62]
MSQPQPGPDAVETDSSWFQPPRWSVRDLAALAVWTAGLCWIFRDAVFFRGAFFYFDVTEINYPYRHFFAEELKAGRFSRWCPWLYCGMPLFSESQAGYLHPLKYLLYPWMETWKAFNLDTVLSIWLAGAGTYGWLRRHVGPAGALTGAALFGVGGFTWAHLVHTSMINALASVPFVVWALEWSWGSGRWRGVALGAFALACQVFAGHLQDVILCSGIVGFYGLFRACTSATKAEARSVLARTFGLVFLGVLLSAVQWVPSKELLDRSPRAGGLTYDELTYGSWSPELLPTLVLREAYGTRARDTDWMDGFYPYHEMNAYLGLLGMALAVVGASGQGGRDRWTTCFALLTITGGLLMLGRFTFLFDYANRIPIAGSSREPVRVHLWVSLGVAALAAVGVERLQRPGVVSLRAALTLVALLVLASLPILAYVYSPIWTDPRRWGTPYHLDRYRWLGRELLVGSIRTGVLTAAGLMIAWKASRTSRPELRARLAAALPVLVLLDLLGAHAVEPVTVSPDYWTSPPETVERLKADPTFVRVFGSGDKSAGEPGYASEPIDFMKMRDALNWSLPAAWGLASAKGETPMIPRRILDYFDNTRYKAGRFDLDSVSHVVTGRSLRSVFVPNEPVGEAFLHVNPNARPRARLKGRPVYASSREEAVAALTRLGPELLERLVVEDPARPLDAEAQAVGTAKIEVDLPEEVAVSVVAETPAYLVLADTFDPGWTATVDGIPAPIVPAYVAFRAVHLEPGTHRVVFRYAPAGFSLGLAATILGGLLAIGLLLRPGSTTTTADHRDLARANRLKAAWLAAVVLIVLASIPSFEPEGISIQSRWRRAWHTFTWGAGVEAMHQNRQ